MSHDMSDPAMAKAMEADMKRRFLVALILTIPVVLYSVAIMTMVASAKAANLNSIMLAGVVMFMVSDIILAQERFTPLANSMLRRAMPYLVWFLYFAGQALIVYGMIG